MKTASKLLIALMVTFLLAFLAILASSQTSWNPMEYDKNKDGSIDITEVVHAIDHYKWGKLNEERLTEVIKVYFGV